MHLSICTRKRCSNSFCFLLFLKKYVKDKVTTASECSVYTYITGYISNAVTMITMHILLVKGDAVFCQILKNLEQKNVVEILII